MLECNKFVDAAYNNAWGQKIDTCLKCGRSLRSHSLKEEKEPAIVIYFGGKIYEFDNWTEAQKRGFYLGA